MAKKLTSTKAKKILHDKEVHGHPLTEQQRKFFGAIAGGAKPYKVESGGWLDKFDAPKAQVGTLITGTSDLISPVYDIFSKIRNLGTSDYSDKKDFDAAYSAAKKAGEEEFVWNSKRYNTKYAGTPRQEVGTYGVQGKPVDLTGLRSDPSRVNLYPMFGKYLPGHLEASIVDGDGYASINYSSAGNRPWLDVIKPEKGEKAYYVYGANRGKFSEKATSLPLGMYSYIYDGVDNRPSDWELFTNNCADNVCDAFGIPRSRGLQTPKGAIEKIKKAYPTLDVTGRTKDDYDKFIRESKQNSLTKERSKDVLSNADRLLNIYYSPDTPSSSKKDIGYALQRSLINQGYELPKSKTKLSELDTIVGDETLGAIKNWKSKNKKQDGGAVEGRMAGLTDKGFNFNPAWGGAWRDGGIIQPPMAGANTSVSMAQLGDSVKPIPMQLAMGGSLPGAVGFTYARVAGAAPSEGPYAKKTMASAQDGIEEPLTKPSVDWFKQWYEQRQALPQFSRVAGKRLDLLSAPPRVELTPIEDLQKFGAVAEYKKVRSVDPSQDILSLADPATMPAYAERLQKERGKPFLRPVDPNLGTDPSVVGHEMSHWLDARAPQSTMLPRGVNRSEPFERYPIFDAAKFKESGLDLPTYRWISNSRLTPIPGVRTEFNSVLNELRQREGLRGDQPTTPEQMKGIMDKYMNLPEDKLYNQTIEGSQNDRIRTLIKYLEKDPAKLSELNNRIVAAPKKGGSTAQNGQEMKFYQEGLDFTPKTISKNGGWLDKYDAPQAQTGKMLEYLKSKKTAPVVTKGEPMSEEMQKRITTETLRRQTQKNKPLTATNTREQAVERGRAENLRVIEENKEYDRQAMVEGKAAEATRENPNVPFTFPTGESKLWKDMDWRERQYVSGRNLGSMSRFNNWTDWINPITMIGEMGEGLATAPYMARETDSNLPYVAGIASPLLGGALGGLGTRNTGQFVNNMINPLAGMDFSSKELSSIPGTKTTSGLFGRSKPKVGIDEELGIAPSGVKSDRHISQDDIQSTFKKEADWLRSDEYLKRRTAATGENPIAVKKDIEKIISRSANTAVNVEKLSKNTLGTYTGSSNIIRLAPHLTKTQALATLDHEVKHAMSQLATTGRGSYSKYPTTTLGNIFTRGFSMPKHMAYLNQPWEQQVRKLRLLDFINESQGVPRGQKLTMENIQQLAEDIKPVTAKDPGGFFAPDFSNRYSDVEHGYISGLIEANEKLKFVPQNLLKMKFPFKLQRQSNQAIRQTLLDQLNKAYVVPGAVTAGTAAAVLGGESEQAPKQQDGGDIPVDPMGYWNPENVGGPVIIPSTDITMEGVDQPLIGISDTGDVQYMYPGEDYEFDGEYVTEYPVAKKGISVNNADAQPLKKLDQLLNFTNYNKPTKGGWLDKYN